MRLSTLIANFRTVAIALLLSLSACLQVACTDDDPLAKARPILLATSEAQRLVQLQDERPNVRRNGVQGLYYSILPNKFELMTAALGDTSWEVRQMAVSELAKTNDPRAVEPLIEAAKDSVSIVRFDAVHALATIGDVRARGALRDALYDDDDMVWKEAEKALRKMGLPNLAAESEQARVVRERRYNENIAAHERRAREEAREYARLPYVGVCTCKNATTGVVLWERRVKSKEECDEQCPDNSSTRFSHGSPH